jgi:sulfur carrier protein
MNIELNGESRHVRSRELAALLQELAYDARSVATALNGRFIPASQRAAHTLSEGDRIEVLAPMQGG